MRRHRFLAEADALADDERTNDTGDTGVDVNDRTAREVESAHLEQIAVTVPETAAVSSFCIFMASRMMMGSPSFTSDPSSTRISMIFPGIGASTATMAEDSPCSVEVRAL